MVEPVIQQGGLVQPGRDGVEGDRPGGEVVLVADQPEARVEGRGHEVRKVGEVQARDEVGVVVEVSGAVSPLVALEAWCRWQESRSRQTVHKRCIPALQEGNHTVDDADVAVLVTQDAPGLFRQGLGFFGLGEHGRKARCAEQLQHQLQAKVALGHADALRLEEAAQVGGCRVRRVELYRRRRDEQDAHAGL